MRKIHKYLSLFALSLIFCLSWSEQAKALILDATSTVVRFCVLKDLQGLGGVVDVFFWGIRVLFVLVVVGIIVIMWGKRNDNENIQEWFRYLAALIIGAGLIGAFEIFFLGSATAAQQSCQANPGLNNNSTNGGGLPPVPNQ